MRNEEQIEMELTQLKGKRVIIVTPLVGMSSIAFVGDLWVVETKEHRCGFHVSNALGGWSIIFYAENVQLLEASVNTELAKTIRLLPRA
jgi:hypothetical protein